MGLVLNNNETPFRFLIKAFNQQGDLVMSNEYHQQCQNNAKNISQEVELLQELLSNGQFKDFWTKVKEINQLFKELKPLSKVDREELWSQFRKICEQAKEQRDERQRLSSEARRRILGNILWLTGTESPLQWNPFGADLVEEAGQINDTVRNARANLANILDDLKNSKNDLTKEDNQECWENWKNASNRLRELHQELCDRSYSCLEPEVREIMNKAHYNEEPREVFGLIKDMQSRIRNSVLTSYQYKELTSKLQSAWEEASERADEIRESRHADWVEKTQAWIERQRTIIEKNVEFITRLEEQVSSLASQANSTNNERYREKLEGWIAEKQTKIYEVEERNRELEDKIEDSQRKLDDSW